MKCKHCGKEFHYCTSCDSDIYSDLGYCSEKCFKNSDRYKLAHEDIKTFMESLSNEQLIRFFDLYESTVFEEIAYEEIIYSYEK